MNVELFALLCEQVGRIRSNQITVLIHACSANEFTTLFESSEVSYRDSCSFGHLSPAFESLSH